MLTGVRVHGRASKLPRPWELCQAPLKKSRETFPPLLPPSHPCLCFLFVFPCLLSVCPQLQTVITTLVDDLPQRPDGGVPIPDSILPPHIEHGYRRLRSIQQSRNTKNARDDCFKSRFSLAPYAHPYKKTSARNVPTDATIKKLRLNYIQSASLRATGPDNIRWKALETLA